MAIPTIIKEHVRAQLLKSLELYFEDAEEGEDEHVQFETNVAERVEDFYEYMYNVNGDHDHN